MSGFSLRAQFLFLGFLLLAFIPVVRGADVDFKLNSSNGSTKFSVIDSLSVEVSSVNSDGNAYFNSLTATNPGNLLRNTNTLQSGSTFYVSSGTVGGQLSVTTLKFSDATTMVSGSTAPSRSFVGHWGRSNLAASLTDSQLVFDVAGAAQVAAGSRIKMPYSGIVRGICVSANAARTAGTATFQVFKNAVDIGASSDAVINATNTQFVCSTAGTGTFVAGDILDVRVTTDGTFAPTTTEYTADILVEWTN